MRGIELLLEAHPDPTLVDVKKWLSSITSTVSRRNRAPFAKEFKRPRITLGGVAGWF